MERRDFLKIAGVGASAALADGCSGQSTDRLIPYLVASDNVVPGVPAYYATTCGACPAGCGLLAKTIDGRVIKAEGNPRHPINAGRLCARGQASVQSLYDPDRFRGPVGRTSNGSWQPISWETAESLLVTKLRDTIGRGRGGAVAWLGGLQTGSMERLSGDLLKAVGSERRLFYEPFEYGALRRAAELTVGRRQIPSYDFDTANFVLSFGAEFLESWLSPVEFAGAFARFRQRRVADPFGAFIAVAPRQSLTVLNADGWVPVPPGTEVLVALSLVHAIVNATAASTSAAPSSIQSQVAPYSPEATARATGVAPETVRGLARQFVNSSPSLAVGGSLTGGGADPVALETAVLLLNAVAGNIGRTIRFDRPSSLDALATYSDMVDLTRAMAGGQIDLLLVHQTNPVYTLPAATGFGPALDRVPFVVSFSREPDETTAHAHLVLPDHHFLESWGDYSPRPGVEGLRQPAMSPMFSTQAAGDVLLRTARAVGAQPPDAFRAHDYAQYVRDYWNDRAWEESLKNGGRFARQDSMSPPEETLRDLTSTIAFPSIPSTAPGNDLGLIVCTSPLLYDGRDANASWLQEVPDPVTKSVWNGYAEVHPDAARGLGIADGDAVTLESSSGRITAAARVSSGVHPAGVAVPLGYGRSAPLRYAGGRGANAFALLSAAPVGGSLPWGTARVKVARAGNGRRLVVLQTETRSSADRSRLPLDAIIRPASVIQPPGTTPPHRESDLYSRHEHPEHRWGMAIDLNTCTGCSACVVACYAENNVPVVGEAGCADGREMSWIRIERYDAEARMSQGIRRTDTVSMPMLCQQCDEAPCEAVCPVFATYHNPEGLNAQVYARCVGTRFCSNNCPYKVRRFNWTRYEWPSPLELQLNPDVTVRSSGVMEKCTFCVQRIQAAKNDASRANSTLSDGDITPACAQTCPAHAIVFGDLNDPASRVSRLAGDRRAFRALEELNTRPAITYLKRVAPAGDAKGT
jgi:molybdopterin-containing oxidoreductase family iron-sulfur binding subunit